MSKRQKYPSHPLTGIELLEKFNTLDGAPREEKARGCGYSYQTSDGSERINMNAFMNALLDAKGIQIDRKERETGRSSKFNRLETRSRLSVTSRGCIYISSFYTEKLKLNHGDQFEIFIKKKSIFLKKTTSKKQ